MVVVCFPSSPRRPETPRALPKGVWAPLLPPLGKGREKHPRPVADGTCTPSWGDVHPAPWSSSGLPGKEASAESKELATSQSCSLAPGGVSAAPCPPPAPVAMPAQRLDPGCIPPFWLGPRCRDCAGAAEYSYGRAEGISPAANGASCLQPLKAKLFKVEVLIPGLGTASLQSQIPGSFILPKPC